jgi:ABC-type lipoprotein export system ATPase subunit
MSSPVVSIVDVSRTIEAHGTEAVLLAPVSVDLHSGTLVAVSGPSGSGKTTLCNIIIGWERSDTGSVRWADNAAASWARLAVAPQRLALLPSLDIRENLALPFWSSGLDVPEPEFDALTQSLEIDTLLRRRPSEVSFGEQQRTAIARAILGSPRLAVLDEPTGHQDEARATLVIDALLAARNNGTCVLVATHDPDIIAAADEVLPLRASSGSSPLHAR